MAVQKVLGLFVQSPFKITYRPRDHSTWFTRLFGSGFFFYFLL